MRISDWSSDVCSSDLTYLNPKLGLIWDVDPTWQIFGNISRSTEPPTFSDLSPTAGAGFADIDPQKATTLEIGTRGRRPDSRWEWGWDVAVYRAWLRDEIQLFDLGGGRSEEHTSELQSLMRISYAVFCLK